MGWLTGWSGRFPIDTQNIKVWEALTNGYYDLADAPADFWANVKNGGGDIRITKADGTTEVAREITSCNTVTEKGEIHFDTTGMLTDTGVQWLIYYGNAAASDYAINATYGAENAWDSSYEASWRMKDATTSTILDSTDNDNDGNKEGANTPIEIVGKIGKGQDFNDHYIAASTFQSLMRGSFTFSFYVKSDDGRPGSAQWLFGSNDNGPEMAVLIRIMAGATDGGKIYFEYESNNVSCRAQTNAKMFIDGANPWHRVDVVADSTIGGVGGLKIYFDAAVRVLDGTLDGDTSGCDFSLWASALGLAIGNANIDGTPGLGVRGCVDEVVFSSVARSPSWIITKQNNLNDPGTFWLTGAAQHEVTVDSFTATPATILSGTSSTLAWTTSNAITSVSIDNGVGVVAEDGSVSVSPTVTTTYTITATGPGGVDTSTVTVTVIPIPIIDSFTATPSEVVNGTDVTLAWATTDVTAVSIDQGIGAVSVDGSTTVNPLETTLYTLTATGPGGTVVSTAIVTVGDGALAADGIRRILGRYRRPRR